MIKRNGDRRNFGVIDRAGTRLTEAKQIESVNKIVSVSSAIPKLTHKNVLSNPTGPTMGKSKDRDKDQHGTVSRRIFETNRKNPQGVNEFFLPPPVISSLLCKGKSQNVNNSLNHFRPKIPAIGEMDFMYTTKMYVSPSKMYVENFCTPQIKVKNRLKQRAFAVNYFCSSRNSSIRPRVLGNIPVPTAKAGSTTRTHPVPKDVKESENKILQDNSAESSPSEKIIEAKSDANSKPTVNVEVKKKNKEKVSNSAESSPSEKKIEAKSEANSKPTVNAEVKKKKKEKVSNSPKNAQKVKQLTKKAAKRPISKLNSLTGKGSKPIRPIFATCSKSSSIDIVNHESAESSISLLDSSSSEIKIEEDTKDDKGMTIVHESLWDIKKAEKNVIMAMKNGNKNAKKSPETWKRNSLIKKDSESKTGDAKNKTGAETMAGSGETAESSISLVDSPSPSPEIKIEEDNKDDKGMTIVHETFWDIKKTEKDVIIAMKTGNKNAKKGPETWKRNSLIKKVSGSKTGGAKTKTGAETLAGSKTNDKKNLNDSTINSKETTFSGLNSVKKQLQKKPVPKLNGNMRKSMGEPKDIKPVDQPGENEETLDPSSSEKQLLNTKISKHVLLKSNTTKVKIFTSPIIAEKSQTRLKAIESSITEFNSSKLGIRTLTPVSPKCIRDLMLHISNTRNHWSEFDQAELALHEVWTVLGLEAFTKNIETQSKLENIPPKSATSESTSITRCKETKNFAVIETLNKADLLALKEDGRVIDSYTNLLIRDTIRKSNTNTSITKPTASNSEITLKCCVGNHAIVEQNLNEVKELLEKKDSTASLEWNCITTDTDTEEFKDSEEEMGKNENPTVSATSYSQINQSTKDSRKNNSEMDFLHNGSETEFRQNESKNRFQKIEPEEKPLRNKYELLHANESRKTSLENKPGKLLQKNKSTRLPPIKKSDIKLPKDNSEKFPKRKIYFQKSEPEKNVLQKCDEGKLLQSNQPKLVLRKYEQGINVLKNETEDYLQKNESGKTEAEELACQGDCVSYADNDIQSDNSYDSEDTFAEFQPKEPIIEYDPGGLEKTGLEKWDYIPPSYENRDQFSCQGITTPKPLALGCSSRNEKICSRPVVMPCLESASVDSLEALANAYIDPFFKELCSMRFRMGSRDSDRPRTSSAPEQYSLDTDNESDPYIAPPSKAGDACLEPELNVWSNYGEETVHNNSSDADYCITMSNKKMLDLSIFSNVKTDLQTSSSVKIDNGSIEMDNTFSIHLRVPKGESFREYASPISKPVRRDGNLISENIGVNESVEDENVPSTTSLNVFVSSVSCRGSTHGNTGLLMDSDDEFTDDEFNRKLKNYIKSEYHELGNIQDYQDKDGNTSSTLKKCEYSLGSTKIPKIGEHWKSLSMTVLIDDKEQLSSLEVSPFNSDDNLQIVKLANYKKRLFKLNPKIYEKNSFRTGTSNRPLVTKCRDPTSKPHCIRRFYKWCRGVFDQK